MADVRDMYVVHTMFRRELGLAPDLIRAVADDDISRCHVVVSHLGMLTGYLQVHHQGEDTLLWPKLLERGGDEIAGIVHLMEDQHETLHHACDELGAALRSWSLDASAAGREAVAVAAERLNAVLVEHISLEEEKILPLAAKYVTAAEWHALGEHGLAATPKKLLPLLLGLVSYEDDDGIMKAALQGAPLPIRLVMPTVGRRVFRSHAKKVHGTPTPPRAHR